MSANRPALAASNPNVQPTVTPVPLPKYAFAASATASPASKENAVPTTIDSNKKPSTADIVAAMLASIAAGTPPKPPGAAPKKRKSDAVEDNKELFPDALDQMDNDDPRIRQRSSKDTCNAVRRKIRNWTESGAMKVGEFQKAIGVSSRSYGSFMNRTGTWDGENCDTYWEALAFFNKRELLGLPLKAAKPKASKKARTSDASSINTTASPAAAKGAAAAALADLLDVSSITLPGEDKTAVPIYDTCDEVRKKIRAFLARDGVTQAALIRELTKMYPGDKSVSAANLRYFMGRKGPLDGNTNATFYAAYVFFEKQRLKAGKPKSKLREEMEVEHGREGVDIETNFNTTGVFVRADEVAGINKYGKFQITRNGRSVY